MGGKTEKPAPRKGEDGGDLDSDDDEWHTTNRGPRYNADGRGGRGGRGRGGRGRGQRGDYRGGKDGVRREPREGEEGRKFGKGEGWKNRENNGERGERSERGERGGRGRGGYRGKRPWTNKDGERKPKGDRENDKPQGEGQAPLKEIGTKDAEAAPKPEVVANGEVAC